MEEQILDYQENNDEKELIPVSMGIRLLNYLIDLVLFYVVFVGIVIVITASGSTFFETIAENPLIDKILSMVFYALFMTIQELVFKGRSVGKFLTGTKVVNFLGQTPDNGVLVTRNLYRAVPFDQLSFLGSRGWHDSWSDTYVVKI